MKKQSTWEKISGKFPILQGDNGFNAFKEILPFYIMVILMMVFIYYQVMRTTPAMEDTRTHALFIFLLAVHLLLYWLIIFFTDSQKWVFSYVFIQGLIIFAIVLTTHSNLVVMALYTAIIGNAIGLLGKQRASLAAIAYYLGLALVSLEVVIVSPQIGGILYTLLPVAAFTAFFAYFFNRQIEARAHITELLKELEEAHQQLTEYTIRVEELTLSAERQRIARELHDTLAQGLAGLILQLEAAVIHIEGQNTEKAGQIVEQAMAQARTTLVDARQAIDDLRTDLGAPAALNDSLDAEVTRFQKATGIPCNLQISLQNQVDSKLSELILRTVTEGLWNIARHAEATQVSVLVQAEAGQIEIEVMDNGVGFNPDEQIGRSGHYGLLGIRERARLANGLFSVESEPGTGTKLRISLPNEPNNEKSVDE
ncbi:MAG: sensor histidine kinase [Chloroflexota bacterium]